MVDVIRTAVTQPLMPEEGRFVRVMSLQKSKGLTSKVVLVASCVEGIMPVAKEDEPLAEQAEILKEQRRLFYVAITRPTEVLVLSSFASIPRALARHTGVQTQGRWGNSTRTSRFIQELGPTLPAMKTGTAWQQGTYS